MRTFNVAVAGATGLVGQEFIKILEQRRFPMKSVRLLASDRSAGRKMCVNGQEIEEGASYDYSTSGTTLSLLNGLALASGDVLRVHYHA